MDYRTAIAVFESGSNVRIDHCQQMCSQGKFYICHLEERQFKSDPALRAAFLTGQNCISVPNQSIMQQCINISTNPISKRLLKGEAGQIAIYLTATAACRDFGVISDHSSPYFATAADLCDHFGIPNYTADGYFALI
ncbi:hypothetical protein FDV58_24835 [Bradyrhizobium elkanii]|uniref:Uncharacterized protein n=1 Tax=Bradyrhizobium elkanii TaxID=29448 RepID=A0A4U6RWB7_BRAEL|nr:hypothetical protein [Bradyrhizobium elkanii]TKV78930.1 hypothetical protein FDV58_24835 [Bradyrhizobium elkanii]